MSTESPQEALLNVIADAIGGSVEMAAAVLTALTSAGYRLMRQITAEEEAEDAW